MNKTFDVYWSPEGRKIATVQAKDMRAAKRKAPKPYRKYLGEIYVVEVPETLVPQYVDVTADQFRTAACTSYTGGAAWFKCDAFPLGWIVFAGTPIEVRAYFEAHPNETVRMSFHTAERM